MDYLFLPENASYLQLESQHKKVDKKLYYLILFMLILVIVFVALNYIMKK